MSAIVDVDGIGYRSDPKNNERNAAIVIFNYFPERDGARKPVIKCFSLMISSRVKLMGMRARSVGRPEGS